MRFFCACLIFIYMENGQPNKYVARSHDEMVKYGKGTRWSPAQNNVMGRNMFNTYTENYGPFTIYVSADKSAKIAHINVKGRDQYFDQSDNVITKEEAAKILGVESLDDFETNDIADFLTNLNIENKINNNKQIKENMSKKKVLRYTEQEFVTLLENIVNRVKKEQRLEESKKQSRKQKISENLERIRRERGTNRGSRR